MIGLVGAFAAAISVALMGVTIALGDDFWGENQA